MDAGGRDSVLTLPPEVLKLTHQLEQEKLESLTRRYDVLRKENELLKTRLEKSATAAWNHRGRNTARETPLLS